ncbi:hypothetical protein [Paenibacillus glycanilyticus]|uniref:hypothetical protein n=1 Tax=Paenibacillus glycanilyticus TaxID=126569 RepID=UPI003EBF7B0F
MTGSELPSLWLALSFWFAPSLEFELALLFAEFKPGELLQAANSIPDTVKAINGMNNFLAFIVFSPLFVEWFKFVQIST